MKLAPKLVLPLSEIFLDGTMRDYAAAKILLKVNSISSQPYHTLPKNIHQNWAPKKFRFLVVANDAASFTSKRFQSITHCYDIRIHYPGLRIIFNIVLFTSFLCPALLLLPLCQFNLVPTSPLGTSPVLYWIHQYGTIKRRRRNCGSKWINFYFFIFLFVNLSLVPSSPPTWQWCSILDPPISTKLLT